MEAIKRIAGKIKQARRPDFLYMRGICCRHSTAGQPIHTEAGKRGRPRCAGELAALLHGVAEWESGPVLTDLARKWTGDDRWYLEALGIGMQGIEAQMWERLRKALLADDPRLFKLAWRLRVPEALPFLVSAMKAGNRLALGDHRLTTVNSGALTTVNQAC